MTAVEIIDALATSHFRRFHQVLVPNVMSMGVSGEADLLILQPSGWLEEVEIKTNKADFKREFKTKPMKHEMLCRGVPGVGQWSKERQAYVRDWSETKPTTIRRYWFAMPYELAQELTLEIPVHAGLIGVFDNKRVSPIMIKKAPVLKCARKLTDKERLRLFELAYARYWDIRLTGGVGR